MLEEMYLARCRDPKLQCAKWRLAVPFAIAHQGPERLWLAAARGWLAALQALASEGRIEELIFPRHIKSSFPSLRYFLFRTPVQDARYLSFSFKRRER
jgi:hypothetical protein